MDCKEDLLVVTDMSQISPGSSSGCSSAGTSSQSQCTCDALSDHDSQLVSPPESRDLSQTEQTSVRDTLTPELKDDNCNVTKSDKDKLNDSMLEHSEKDELNDSMLEKSEKDQLNDSMVEKSNTGDLVMDVEDEEFKMEPEEDDGDVAPLDLSTKPSDLTSFDQPESDQQRRTRLFNNLSSSYGGSALVQALRCARPRSASTDDTVTIQEPSKNDTDSDDDLRPLDWLQDTDVLKGLNLGSDGESLDSDGGGKENRQFGQPVYSSLPPHVPYNPRKHVNTKPPYSFSCLIFMAIEESPAKKLPVKDIYNWIMTNFPFYQNAPTGWKNSVRHNLSLNKCFRKVEKDRSLCIGKGSLWMIDPDYRPNLLQALRKTPYSPYHQLQLTAPQPLPQHTMFPSYTRPSPLTIRQTFNMPQPNLFPMLSRRLNWPVSVKREPAQADDTDIAEAARSLVDFKNALASRQSPRESADESDEDAPEFGSIEEHRRRRFKRRTSSPVEKAKVIDRSRPLWAVHGTDHTYSFSSWAQAYKDADSEADSACGGCDKKKKRDAEHLLSDVDTPDNWTPNSSDVDDLDDSGISPSKQPPAPQPAQKLLVPSRIEQELQEAAKKPRRSAANKANRERYMKVRSQIADQVKKEKAEETKKRKLDEVAEDLRSLKKARAEQGKLEAEAETKPLTKSKRLALRAKEEARKKKKAEEKSVVKEEERKLRKRESKIDRLLQIGNEEKVLSAKDRKLLEKMKKELKKKRKKKRHQREKKLREAQEREQQQSKSRGRKSVESKTNQKPSKSSRDVNKEKAPESSSKKSDKSLTKGSNAELDGANALLCLMNRGEVKQ